MKKLFFFTLFIMILQLQPSNAIEPPAILKDHIENKKLSQTSIDELKKVLSYFINDQEDFVLFFKMCNRDWQKKESYGHEEINNTQNDKFTIL